MTRMFSRRYYCSRYLVTCLLLFVASCTGTRDLSVVNLSGIYRNADRFFHPEFAVAHASDTTSRIVVLLNTKELLFSRQSDDRFRAFFSVHYKLAEAYESIKTILDSGNTSFQVSEEEKNLPLVYEVPFRLPKKSEMLLIVSIRDNQKNYAEEFYVPVDNASRQSRQSFSAQAKNENHILFRNYVSDHDSVKISFRDSSVKKLFVRAYSRTFPLAPPPFSFDVREEFDYRPDHTFTYDVNDTNYINLKQQGFYHFQSDTADRNGFTLYVYPGSFPAVTSPEQMLECVRYLTTKREFEEMKANPNKKAAMDKFWLDLGGNADRTKHLIRKYYTRIREANQYFSSYTAGWRTDRGLVYTVFGKPNNVYKSSTAESWIYGTPNNALSVNFFFTRVINPFSDNDYMLTREPLFEGSWMRAVDVWRQGRVYNDN
jgi:GWxTD domain-containing protein